MIFPARNETLHSDDVIIQLHVEGNEGDEPFFNNFTIGFAESINWKYNWNTKIYRPIGGPPLGSDIFRNNLTAQGQLKAVVLRKHPEVDMTYIDIGTKLILGQYDYEGFGKGIGGTKLFYNDIQLSFYAVSAKKGYVFKRIIPTSVEGGVVRGEFLAETMTFNALDVEAFTI